MTPPLDYLAPGGGFRAARRHRRQCTRDLRRAVRHREPVTHPGPVPPDFERRYHRRTREGRKLRRLGKRPSVVRRMVWRIRGVTGPRALVLRGLAGHWEAAAPRADHARCAQQVEEIRAYHRSTGYRDIAYSFLFCQHGQVFVGRGWGDSAATCGSPWNGTHASACWMGGPGHVPSAAAYGALAVIARDGRARGATSFIGHRDACPTQCPGNEIYARMHSPALFEGGGDPAPVPVEEPDLDEHEHNMLDAAMRAGQTAQTILEKMIRGELSGLTAYEKDQLASILISAQTAHSILELVVWPSLTKVMDHLGLDRSEAEAQLAGLHREGDRRLQEVRRELHQPPPPIEPPGMPEPVAWSRV